MSPDELKQERLRRGMTYAEFGEWVAQQLTAADPDGKEVKPYSRQRIYDWENKIVPVPSRVEAMLLREEIARLERLLKHERSPAAGHEITEDEPGRKELEEKRERLKTGKKPPSKKRARSAERDGDW
ncbi:hypothetical protein [Hyphomonas sp.]|uniref:hypothetical protein n=1 Tax=Hyphomonas sp. TaxID=87 RepID=UPI000C628E9F|nr:hypothetical protein [Hyphomonas sp.]MAB09953.1 hypothetical protein [Hyphomonas sp.]MAU66687.1 hypothetical protein [Hyphomonas sp.]MBM57647.1 hypothetical protein [Hyphomonas sp.]